MTLFKHPKSVANRPKIVAILEIATLLFSLGGVAGACVGKVLDNAFLFSVAKCVLDLQHLGVAGSCVGKALDNAFLLSVAKCVLDLQYLGVAT